jgi:hypothetical protein
VRWQSAATDRPFSIAKPIASWKIEACEWAILSDDLAASVFISVHPWLKS